MKVMDRRKRRQNLKLCFALFLFIMMSFMILIYGFLKASMLPAGYEDINFTTESDHSSKIKELIETNRSKEHYSNSYDVNSLADTVIKNIFAAFKYVEDIDFNDTSFDFSNHANVKVFDHDVYYFDHVDLSNKFWYRFIIWEIVFILFVEFIVFAIKNIIYIHKLDGKKGINSIYSLG